MWAEGVVKSYVPEAVFSSTMEEISETYPWTLIKEIEDLPDEVLRGVYFIIFKNTIINRCEENLNGIKFEFKVSKSNSYSKVLEYFNGCYNFISDNKNYIFRLESKEDCKQVSGVVV